MDRERISGDNPLNMIFMSCESTRSNPLLQVDAPRLRDVRSQRHANGVAACPVHVRAVAVPNARRIAPFAELRGLPLCPIGHGAAFARRVAPLRGRIRVEKNSDVNWDEMRIPAGMLRDGE